MPTEHRRLGDDRHLVPAGGKRGPYVLIAEQTIGRAPHEDHIVCIRADAAENSKHALNEERRLDQPAVEKMRKVVKMADVIALVLEARAVVAHQAEDARDVFEGIAEDRAFAIDNVLLFPWEPPLVDLGPH